MANLKAQQQAEHTAHLDAVRNLDISIISITQPYPSVHRVRAQMSDEDPDFWSAPNMAIRLVVDETETAEPISRVYTIRDYDAANSQLEIDFVQHADASAAMQWLNSAKTGSKIKLLGAKPHFVPHFKSGQHLLMFADDTAVPALYSLLQHWPAGQSADIYIETLEANLSSYLPKPAQVKLHILVQNHAQPSYHLLYKAAQQIALNDKKPAVWAACERQQARALRQHFLDQQIQRKDLQIAGYWKSGISSTQLDQLRSAHYLAHTQQGKPLQEYDDLDMPN